MKTIFRIGDKVYDINYGWGKVVDVFDISFNTKPDYRVLVNFKQDFNKEISIYYSMDGSYRVGKSLPTLSFTEYDLVKGGFTQKRLIDYEKCIGKWGKFWDINEKRFIIGKLLKYVQNAKRPFEVYTRDNEIGCYQNFKLLKGNHVRILNLE